MSNTIAATVKGIRTPTDLECFEIFTVEIDGQGSDLWHFRKIPQEKKSARKVRQEMIPEEADLMREKVGQPGDELRIQALAEFYGKQSQEKSEESPFLVLTESE